jgi:hypothetical protein
MRVSTWPDWPPPYCSRCGSVHQLWMKGLHSLNVGVAVGTWYIYICWECLLALSCWLMSGVFCLCCTLFFLGVLLPQSPLTRTTLI